MAAINPGTGVDIFIGEDVPGEFTDWENQRVNLCQRPTPVTPGDWLSPTTTLDATFTRRRNVPTLHRDVESNYGILLSAVPVIDAVPGHFTPVTPGLPYTISVYASGSTPTFEVRLTALWFDELGGSLGYSDTEYITGGVSREWLRASATFTPPENVALAAWEIIVGTDDTDIEPAHGWLTDCLIEQTDEVRPWFSGDSGPSSDLTRVTWLGAPTVSASAIQTREVIQPPRGPHAYWSNGGYTITEDSTPVDPSDTTGGIGQISAAIADSADVPTYLGKPLSLVDGHQGEITGIVRGMSGNGLQADITADSRISLTAVTRQAQPFVGTLGDALRYYLELCSITTGIVIHEDLEDIPVRLLGWSAVVYDQLKKLAVVHKFEMALVSNNVVFRPVRTRVAENYRDGQVSWAMDATELAQTVEGYSYNTTSGTALAYPPGGWTEDVTVYTVDAGQTTEIQLELEASLESIDQPTCVAFVNRNHSSSSVYSVSGNDGIAIQPAQWEAGGGSLEVSINEDTRSLTLKITGSGDTQYAPYRIAVSSGPSDYYSSLRIRGTGVFYEKKLMTLPAALDPDRAPMELGATVDNEFYEDDDALYHGLLWTASRYTHPRQTLNVTSKGINRRGESGSARYPTIDDVEEIYGAATIDERFAQLGPTIQDWEDELFARVRDDFENQAFGNVGGARVLRDGAWYRIRSATINPASISYSAEWDTTIDDCPEETIAEWEARWAGKTIAEYDLAPLAGL